MKLKLLNGPQVFSHSASVPESYYICARSRWSLRSDRSLRPRRSCYIPADGGLVVLAIGWGIDPTKATVRVVIASLNRVHGWPSPRSYEGDQRRGTKTEKQASHRDGIIRKPLHCKLLSRNLRLASRRTSRGDYLQPSVQFNQVAKHPDISGLWSSDLVGCTRC